MQPIIKETKNRTILYEGRNTGMGFAFLKREDDTYSTVNPLSPCKDYLNEVVFTENTGIGSKAHGLVYSMKNNIFEDYAYMAIKIVKNIQGSDYYYSSSFEKDQEKLQNNYKNIERLLDYFEDELGLERRTQIIPANDNYFLVILPLEWTISTIAISLYTLILRAGLVFDGKQNELEFLESYEYNQHDKDLITPAIPKIKHILKLKTLPKQPDFSETFAKEGIWSPHNLGILSYQI